MEEMVIVSDYRVEDFAKKVTDKVGCHYTPVRIHDFSDGEPDIQIRRNIRNRNAYYICTYYPKPKERDTEIKLVNSALKYSSAEKIISVPIYLGFMKKDWKDRPRVPISIREIAVGTMEPYVNRVVTIDTHSKQVQSIFRIPFDHLDGTVLFADHIKKNYDLSRLAISSTDLGGSYRARSLLERIGIGIENLVIVFKIRDPKTREVKAERIMGDVEGKDVIIIDDQALSFDSFIEAEEMIRKNGARNIYGYCTHAIMTKKKGVRAEERLARSSIKRLYVTNTIPRPPNYFKDNPKIEVIPCDDLFAEALQRIHSGDSLSDLFYSEE